MTKLNIARSRLWEFLAWICSCVAFAPAVVWLGKGVSQSGQLADALIILVCACVALAFEYGVKPRFPRISTESAIWLCSGYLCILCAGFFGAWAALAILAGLSASVVAAGLSMFDKKRWVYATGAAFFCFTLLSLVMGAFDLPLRAWAGMLATYILGAFNDTAMLVASGGISPQIAIRVGGESYLVAAECNGFGIISASLVLALVVAVSRKNIALWRRFTIVVLCALFAYVMNSLRIVAIILLAPKAGAENYHFMHEFVGYLCFGLALFLIWRFAKDFGKRED